MDTPVIVVDCKRKKKLCKMMKSVNNPQAAAPKWLYRRKGFPLSVYQPPHEAIESCQWVVMAAGGLLKPPRSAILVHIFGPARGRT